MNLEPINGISIEIASLNYCGVENPDNFILSLKEKDGNRAFSILINAFDAQLIAIVLDKIELPAPLVYDIFNKILMDNKTSITSVLITAVSSGIFYAEIHLDNGKIYDCRPTDGIIFALKNNIDILIEESVLNEIGYDIEEEEKKFIKKTPTKKSKFKTELIDENTMSNLLAQKDYDGAELARLELIDNYTVEMEEAVKNEEYEKASIMRDKIIGLKKTKIFG